MSALYARLDTDASKNQATRRGHQLVSTTLETWDGEIRMELDRHGNFRVYVGSKGHADTMIVRGNVNDGLQHVVAVEDPAI